jgi:plastocyanin
MQRLAVLFVVLAGLLAVLSIACSSDDNGESEGGGDGSGGQTLTLTAKGTIFTTQLLAVGPNRQVTFEFVNDDEGRQHNVAFFRTEIGGDPFFRVEPVVGKQTTTTPFQTPEVGTYFYRCQFHPEAMRGDLVVSQR